MRRVLTILALMLAPPAAGLAACGAAWAQDSAAELQAVVVVEGMMDAMGGPAGWEKARYLRFDWVVERDGNRAAHVRHLWDRYQGRYRVEWETRDKKKIVALFNVNGTVHAIDGTCTHRGGPLGEGELDGIVVTCPWHGAQFDVTTGAVLGSPAPQGVTAYKVVVEADTILIEMG